MDGGERNKRGGEGMKCVECGGELSAIRYRRGTVCEECYTGLATRWQQEVVEKKQEVEPMSEITERQCKGCDKTFLSSKGEMLCDKCTGPRVPINLDRMQQFNALTAKMAETYQAKNSDYGNSFDNTMDKYGNIAFIVRASDKWERIEQLQDRAGRVKDEKLEDTVMDLAMYCIMWLMWHGRGKARTTSPLPTTGQ